MSDKRKAKRVVTAKLDADVHMMLKILAKRYKAKVDRPGRVSISDAARYFIADHDEELADAARRMADEQEDLAADSQE